MRLLIAMIGLGQKQPDGSFAYKPAQYALPGGDAQPESRYHQPDLATLIKADALWLVGTSEARERHAQHIPHQRFVEIPKGADPNEFWAMYGAITGALAAEHLPLPPPGQDPHDVILDLTHGFRIQPLFLLSAVRYACALEPQRLRLSDVRYAMFEEGEKVQQLVSLQPVLDMEAIAAEVRDFLGYGQAAGLVARLQGLDRRLGRELGELAGLRSDLKILRKIHKELENFAAIARLNLTPIAAGVARNLCLLAAEAPTVFQGEWAPLGQALGALARQLKPHLPDEPTPHWRWHTALAKWCLERGLDQQALTHAAEMTTTRWCEEHGRNWLDRDGRQPVSRALQGLIQQQKETGDVATVWLDLLKASATVTEARNQVNHAATSVTDIKPLTYAKKVRQATELMLAAHAGLATLGDLIINE